MSKKHIIEIVGLPGSGKSYILNKINDINYVKKIDEDYFYQLCRTISGCKKIFYTFIFLPKLIRIRRLLLKFEFEQGVCEDMKLENKNFIKYYILQKIIIKSMTEESVLLDQWNIQYIVSLVLSSNCPIKSSHSLRKLINIVGDGHKYTMLFYDVDATISAKRALSRKKKFRMDIMPIDELRRYYSIHHDDFKVVGKKYFRGSYDTFVDLMELKEKVKKYA